MLLNIQFYIIKMHTRKCLNQMEEKKLKKSCIDKEDSTYSSIKLYCLINSSIKMDLTAYFTHKHTYKQTHMVNMPWVYKCFCE